MNDKDMVSYETYIPHKFLLDNEELIVLKAYEIEEAKEPLFFTYIPTNKVDVIYNHLKSKGFENAKPSIKKGEKYSIRKILDYPWELHLRIYDNGIIESEIEVQREYLEHLGDKRIYVVYEPFEYLRDIYDKFHLIYKRDRMVMKVIDNFRIALRPPKSLTPWKPIVISLVALTSIGILAYTLDRLSKGEKWLDYRKKLEKLFSEALEYINKNDSIQASEKLYKVSEDCIKILAEINDLQEYKDALNRERWSRVLLYNAIKKLKEIYGERIGEIWDSADSLHVWGFHEEKISIDEVKSKAVEIEELLKLTLDELKLKKNNLTE